MTARGDIAMPCPHCEGKSKIRTSRSISTISKELSYQCTNINCGHTWVALISIVRTIVPSQIPNPKVYIQMTDRTHQPAAPPAS